MGCEPSGLGAACKEFALMRVEEHGWDLRVALFIFLSFVPKAQRYELAQWEVIIKSTNPLTS